MTRSHSAVRLGCRIALVFLTAGLVAVLTLYGPARGQQVHRNSFENRAPAWVKGQADAKFTEVVHEVTDQTAHTGQWSEHLQVDAERGSYVQYLYNLGRAPLSEDLDISLWVKANRPGVQFMARLVLPHERKPGDLNEPLTTMLRGERYQLVNRWERLELRRPLDPNKPPDTPSKNTSTKDGKTAPPAPMLHGPLRLAKDEQQLLRAELGRDVDFTDAYIDQLVLNVYSGPGLNEVWIDDIEAGPVYPDVPEAAATGGNAVPGTPASRTGQPTGRTAVIELNRFLMVNNKRFFFRGIRHTGTPLNVLRDAGFNCVWLDPQAPPALVEEALNLGLWLVPTLPVGDSVTTAQSTEALNQQVARFLPTDAVLFWDLGGGRTMEESLQIAHTAQAVHALDPQAQRPVGVDVWDGYRTYSRDPYVLVGAHRWPLMTSLELPQYREWLIQRRRLANPGAFQWTWVQTHLPEWYTALVYDRPKDAAGKPTQPDTFNEPVGPQPEQIRLLGARLLFGPLPGRQPPGTRSSAAARVAQPGIADAGAVAAVGGRTAGMDRDVEGGCEGCCLSHRARRAGAADVVGHRRTIRARSGRVQWHDDHRAAGAGLHAGLGNHARRGALPAGRARRWRHQGDGAGVRPDDGDRLHVG
jgi:hypothetical protein